MTITNGGSVADGNAFIAYGTSSNGTVLVSGASSSWNIKSGGSAGQLVIGYGGTGNLTVDNSASLAAGNAFIGGNAGAHGTLTVGPTTAAAFDAATLTVGDAGNGTMLLDSGTVATTGSIVIGAIAGGTGTATVTGSGSVLNDGGDLIVGGAGTGVLTVTNSGKVAVTGSIDIGASVGSSGTIDLIGVGAVLTDPTVKIGDAGTGLLQVTQGNDLSLNDTVVLVVQATGNGTLYIDGSGSFVSILQSVTLGQAGTGNLIVQDFGFFTFSANLEAANAAGSHAVATITGTTGVPADNIQGNLDLGVAGTADWTMQTGAVLDVGGAITLGVSTGSQGTLTLTDDGTLLTPTGNVTVGGTGTGTATVQNGASLDAAGSLTIASPAGSTGTLTIDAAGGAAAVDAASLTVGSGGDGTVTVDNGGALATTFGGAVTIGQSAGGKGDVTVTNSALDDSGNLTVGSSGDGDLVLQASTLTVGGSSITLASSVGSSGTLEFQAASYLDFIGSVTVGSSGSGELDVTQGSVVNATNDKVTIGSSSGSDGTLTIDGLGSAFEEGGATGSLTIGSAGKGDVTVSNGGLLSTGAATLGSSASSNTSTAELDIGGVWVDSGTMTVGKSAVGMLSINSGSTVAVGGNVTVASSKGADGSSVVVNGVTNGYHSSLLFQSTLIVGSGAGGTLTAQAGGVVAPTTSPAGTGVVEIGAGGKGKISSQITVTDPGSELVATAIFVGGNTTASGSAGTLSIANSGVVSTGSLLVYRGDAVDVTGPSAGSTGGILDIGNGLSGSGNVTIANAGDVTIYGSAASATTIVFSDGDSDLLNLGTPLQFASTIKGFQTGDTIDLLNTPATAFTLAKGQLTITNNGTTEAVLNLSGHYTQSQFSIASDLHGGTFVTVNTGPVVLAPAVTAAGQYVPFGNGGGSASSWLASGPTMTNEGLLSSGSMPAWHLQSG